MPTDAPNALERWLKAVGVALTLAGLLAGGYEFTRNQAVDAARPFLEKKLRWCEEAVEVAAGIAVQGRESLLPPGSSGQPVRRTERFWMLYWGLMGMVENEDITNAMVAFGNNLRSGDAAADASLSLRIAHACRSEMARSWSPIWGR